MRKEKFGEKKNGKRWVWSLIAVFLVMAVIQPGIVQAATSSDDIALQALRNNYQYYMDGQSVDGAWGNFSAFDGYLIEQAGGDLGSWVYESNSFEDGVIVLMEESLASEGSAEQSPAKRLAGEYLAALELGENDKAEQILQCLTDRQAVSGNGSFDSNAFSDLPALDLLGRAGAVDEIDTEAAITYVLGEQDASGAWTASWNDIMSTAEAIRALKYLEPYAGAQSAAVSDAIDTGCAWLQTNQQDNGSFQDAFGFDDPAVDSSEVVQVLDCLGLAQDSWVSGEGHSALDYILNDAINGDGSFGSSRNSSSSTWVLDACLAAGAVVNGAEVLGLSIEPSTAAIEIGESQQYTAEAYTLAGNSEDASSDCDWSVEDIDIASLSGEGLVTGISCGETTVSADHETLYASALVVVERNSGGNGGSEPEEERVAVWVAVVGPNEEILYQPGGVKLYASDQYGLTVAGALDATGLDWSYSESFPGFIDQIDGIRNEGMAGWMYKVNEEVPGIPADEYELDSGDQVIWWYSDDASSSGPTWEQLNQQAAAVPLQNSTANEARQMLLVYQNNIDQSPDELVIVKGTALSQQERERLLEELYKNTVNGSFEAGIEENIFADSMQEVMLLVPENALNRTMEISIMEVNSKDAPQQYAIRFLSSAYDLTPDGSRFDQALLMAIRCPLSEEEDFQRLGPAWYDEANREWQRLPAVIDLSTGWIVFRIDHFTSLAVIETPAKVIFDDVGADLEWARPAIEILAGQGIIRGTGAGFEPGRTINRSEFVAMVARALQLQKQEQPVCDFSDVQVEDWFYDALQAASQEELVSGFPDGSFRPGEMITRNEAAVIFARMGREERVGTDEPYNFSDAEEIPVWAREGVQYCSQAGLMSGYEDGSFWGGGWLTRAEAALLFYRYLNLMAAEM